MSVAHFYHVYADGFWRNPVAEHLAALEDARFDGPFIVGIVGAPANRAEVLDELGVLRKPDRAYQADQGWEQVTLVPARNHARKHDGAVMYAHTKGAARKNVFQDQWRQSMTANLILKWHNARDALESGHYDVVGCHWLTAEEYPHVQVQTPFPMFGGNFWMAANTYLRRLPPVGQNTRHQAESWVGFANPRVLDLTPGWPGQVPFPRHKMRRLVAGRA